jgi:hypothetical protein
MAFGMRTTTGDYRDIIPYNALSGRFLKRDKGATGETVQTDITSPTLQFAIDYAAFQIGWVYFSPNGPVKPLVPHGQPVPPQPEDKDAKGKLLAKPGLSILFAGNVLGGVREATTTTIVFMDALEETYHLVVGAPEFAAGKIPLVLVGPSIPITRGTGAQKSTNYKPSFSIKGWVDRTPEMGPRTVFPSAAGITAPATNGAAHPVQPTPVPPAAQLIGDQMPS